MRTTSLVVAFSLVLITGHTSLITANDSVVNNTMGGQALVDMGKEVDAPFLKMIGKIIINLEHEIRTLKDQSATEEICRLHNCTDWNEWSQCNTSNNREFGSRTRNRTCGFNTTLCIRYSAPKVEYKSEVCEHTCRNDYTITKHGFCVKLYSDKKNRQDAENVCLHDQGYLVNIDSENKVQDMNKILLENSVISGGVWIDGIRSEASAVWKYFVEPTDALFTFWEENEPNLADSQLCKVYFWHSINRRWRWHDGVCAKLHSFICQIIPQI